MRLVIRRTECVAADDEEVNDEDATFLKYAAHTSLCHIKRDTGSRIPECSHQFAKALDHNGSRDVKVVRSRIPRCPTSNLPQRESATQKPRRAQTAISS